MIKKSILDLDYTFRIKIVNIYDDNADLAEVFNLNMSLKEYTECIPDSHFPLSDRTLFHDQILFNRIIKLGLPQANIAKDIIHALKISKGETKDVEVKIISRDLLIIAFSSSRLALDYQHQVINVPEKTRRGKRTLLDFNVPRVYHTSSELVKDHIMSLLNELLKDGTSLNQEIISRGSLKSIHECAKRINFTHIDFLDWLEMIATELKKNPTLQSEYRNEMRFNTIAYNSYDLPSIRFSIKGN